MTDELKPCCDYTTDIRCIFYESDEFGTRCRMHMGVQNPNYDDEVIRPKSCNMHFTREEMQRVIAAWNTRHESGELPEWLKEKINERINFVDKQLAELRDIHDTSDDDQYLYILRSVMNWVLSLRKEEIHD